VVDDDAKKVVSVRLSPQQIKFLDELVEKHIYASRGEAIRAAIRLLMSRYGAGLGGGGGFANSGVVRIAERLLGVGGRMLMEGKGRFRVVVAGEVFLVVREGARWHVYWIRDGERRWVRAANTLRRAVEVVLVTVSGVGCVSRNW